MFSADPKALARIAADLDRVAVFDPHPYAAKMVGDILRHLGARQIVYEGSVEQALEAVAKVEPTLICTEHTAPGFQGMQLVSALRRSALAARRAPVIVIAAEATVESIRAARDAGAHEFLRKPFNARDLFRRVENVSGPPRPWIEAQMYVGPDRRRFNAGEFRGPRKRRADRPAPAEFLDLAS